MNTEIHDYIADDDIGLYLRYEELVLKYLAGVDRSKSPGYPWNLTYGTNQQVLEEERNEVIKVAIAKLYMFMNWADEIEEMVGGDPMGYILAGLADPSTVFIKDEPHRAEKVAEGKYRCINPVSITDQIVQHVFFTEKAGIWKSDVNLYVSGSAIGIGFSDEQRAVFRDVLRKMLRKWRKLITSDVSGFDSLHTEKMYVEGVHELDKRMLKTARQASLWWKAQRLWFIMIVRSCAVLVNEIVARTVNGMMSSGCILTSNGNTILRLLYDAFIALFLGLESTFSIAAGDDCVSFGFPGPEKYIEAAKHFGITVRDVVESDHMASFCSHTFDVNKEEVPLESYVKAIAGMLCKPDADPFDMRQTLHEMRDNDCYDIIKQFLDAIAPLHEGGEEVPDA